MMDINEKDERRELLDAVADAGRLARGLDQLLESLAHADQLDLLDVEGVLALRSISERCAERIGDAARILEAQNEDPLCPRNGPFSFLSRKINYLLCGQHPKESQFLVGA